MIGIGGGLANVPFLIYLMNQDPKFATLVSSSVIICTSTTSFLNYRRDNKIDYKTFKQYIPLVVIGSIIGGFAAESLPTHLIKQVFGIFVIASGIRGVRRSFFASKSEDEANPVLNPDSPNYRKIIDRDGNEYEYEVKLKTGQFFALLGGLLAGTIGVGGGIVFVPLLNIISDVPIHVAAPTSMTMIVVSSTIAVITRLSIIIRSGDPFDWAKYFTYVIPMGLGSVIGATIGPRRVKRVNSKQLLGLFWATAVLAGIRMLIG